MSYCPAWEVECAQPAHEEHVFQTLCEFRQYNTIPYAIIENTAACQGSQECPD